ncbi:MAG: DUF72 domain-containing protein [Actinomycetota bacterium]|nr:DUF72 domain-containing protein [Actinomycetota bacterium]
MRNIFIGTSGYSYEDWNINFYPSELDKKEKLKYYSKFFNTVEINFTYYKLPYPRIFKGMADKVDSDFIFSVKAHSGVTHSRDFKSEDISQFVSSLQPFIKSKRMGAVLIQFPWSFKFSTKNCDYLKSIRESFKDLELCAEFRNNSWLKDKTFNCLTESDIGFCNVDEPRLKGLLPPTGINTSKNGYIRFHGRNNLNWWNPKFSYQRYDYLYSREELAEWVPGIKKVAANTGKTMVYFNNHYKAQAVRSAKILQELIGDSDISTSQN